MLRRNSRARGMAEGEREQLAGFIAGAIRIRFDVSAEQFAERLIALATAAGVSPWDHAQRVVLDDLYLATACAAGQSAAWRECEALHFPFIRTFARRFLPDALARDLADQIIADLWQRRKIGSYAGRSTLRTWLGAVVAHSALNMQKTSLACVTPGGETFREYARRHSAPDSRPSPEEEQAERMLADLIVHVIERLNPEEKLLLQMHYEQGLTLEQMEAPLGASKATLSRRLKRIREHVKARIDELAERTHGTPLRVLRERLALDRLEFDLSAVLRVGLPVEERGRDSV